MKRICLLSISILALFSSVLISQTPQKTVIAKSGDGIYVILRKNGLDPSKYYQEFVELNKKNIGKKNGLYIGRRYILPVNQEQIVTQENVPTDTIKVAPELVETDTIIDTQEVKEEPLALEPEPAKTVIETIEEPLFGSKLATVTIESKELEGAIYYLISGHGGPDPGALAKQGNRQIAEDEYAYDVNLRLARKLIAKGAKVFIIIRDPNDGIRDKRILEIDYDEVNYPKKRIPRSQRLRLRQRTETVNKLFRSNGKGYQRLIVTHVDSRSVGEVIDVFFYHHHRSIKGKKLAQNLQSTFRKKYARYQPNRKYAGTVASRSSLYVIKNTLPAMVYIELGNLKNSRDQRRILNYENREALAKWISEGLIVDFKGTI